MIFFFIASFLLYSKSNNSPEYLVKTHHFLKRNYLYTCFLCFGLFGIGVLNLQQQMGWSTALVFGLLAITLIFSVQHIFLTLSKFYLIPLFGISLLSTLLFSV